MKKSPGSPPSSASDPKPTASSSTSPEKVPSYQTALIAPLPGEWILVKDHDNQIWWVNQKLNEVSEDPPNLDELRQNFQRVKNKTQMMEKRGEDEKRNARKKILRNIPDPDDIEFGTIREDLKTKDFLHPNMGNTKNQQRKTASVSPDKTGKEPPKNSATRNNRNPVEDLFEQQTTDPKMKRATIEDSIGSFDFGPAQDFVEDDPYKYTKSTLKKANEDLTTPPWKSSQSNRLRPEKKKTDLSLEHSPNEMPILEMNLDLNDLGDELDGHFITPSGKKKDPVRDKRSKHAAQPRDSPQPQRDSGVQMVNSSVLEKMLSDIQKMQMKMSSIEEDNNLLKRKNLELLDEQKKLKHKSELEMHNTKQEIEQRIKQKETKFEDMLKEELAKKDKEQANLNIQKDIQGIKELLQQSLTRNTINQASAQATSPSAVQPNPADIQSSLPVVDSQLMPNSNAQLLAPGQPNHSFGMNLESAGTLQAAGGHYQLANNNQNFMMSSLGSPHFGSNVRAPMPSQFKQTANPSGTLASKASASHTSVSLVQKWLQVISSQSDLLKKIRAELGRRRTQLKSKELSIRDFEMEMNKELGSMGLDTRHSLVGKIKKNIHQQISSLAREENYYQHEVLNYRDRKKHLGVLNQTLIFLQTLGSLGPDEDRQLEELYAVFKNIEHFAHENDDTSTDSFDVASEASNKDSKPLSSASQRDALDGSPTAEQPNPPNVDFSKKATAMPIVVLSPGQSDYGSPDDAEPKADPTKGLVESQKEKNLTSSILRREAVKKNTPILGEKSEATGRIYLDEMHRSNRSAAQKRFEAEQQYPQQFANTLGFTSVSGYYPNYSRTQEDQSTTNIRRYLHAQSKWYSDMRSEVSDFESR